MVHESGTAQVADTLLEALTSSDRLRWEAAVQQAANELEELTPNSSIESEFRELTLSVVEGLETCLNAGLPEFPSARRLEVYRELLRHVSQQPAFAPVTLH